MMERNETMTEKERMEHRIREPTTQLTLLPNNIPTSTEEKYIIISKKSCYHNNTKDPQ